MILDFLDSEPLGNLHCGRSFAFASHHYIRLTVALRKDVYEGVPQSGQTGAESYDTSVCSSGMANPFFRSSGLLLPPSEKSLVLPTQLRHLITISLNRVKIRESMIWICSPVFGEKSRVVFPCLGPQAAKK